MIEFQNTVIAKTLEKLHGGEALSNKEIETTIEELEPVVELIDGLGQKYNLFWKELFFDLGMKQ